MILGITTVVVLVLLAVALFPSKKRDGDRKPSGNTPFQLPTRSINLREQQLQEEADAIASEYRRRADEEWLSEVNAKAAALLKPSVKSTRSS